MPLFSQNSLRQTLGSKGLGGNINKSLQSATGAKSSSAAKSQFMKSLAGKSNQQRERVYKEFGLGYSNRKQIEGVISEGDKTYTKSELVKIHRAEESKKKLNIFMSKRSAAEGGSGYETSSSSFAGGAVETKSRVGALDKGKEERQSTLGQKKMGGFALGSASNAGSGFALGQAKASNKGFALGSRGGEKKDDDENDAPKRPSGLSFGGGV